MNEWERHNVYQGFASLPIMMLFHEIWIFLPEIILNEFRTVHWVVTGIICFPSSHKQHMKSARCAYFHFVCTLEILTKIRCLFRFQVVNWILNSTLKWASQISVKQSASLLIMKFLVAGWLAGINGNGCWNIAIIKVFHVLNFSDFFVSFFFVGREKISCLAFILYENVFLVMIVGKSGDVFEVFNDNLKENSFSSVLP